MPHAARLGDIGHVDRVPDWQVTRGLLMPPSPRDSNGYRRRTAAFPLQRAAPMTRFIALTVMVLGMVLAADRVASAQATGGSGLPNGATIVFDHREIYNDVKNDGTFFEPQPSSVEFLHYFNRAHCNCAKANVGKPNTLGTFNYHTQESTGSGLHVGVDFWAGTTCDDQTHRTGGSAPTCVQLTANQVRDIDNDLLSGGKIENFNLFEVVNANLTNPNGGCLELDNANNSIFALVDTVGGSTNYNYSASLVVGTLNGETATTGTGVDTKPPPAPASATIDAQGGDGAIHLSWDALTSGNTDVAYYQALCADMDGNPAFASASNTMQYSSSAALCGLDDKLTVLHVPAVADGGTAPPPPAGAFGNLDPRYICGQSASATATSLDINGLTNGKPYNVILLTIDLHGNFAETVIDDPVTPVPSTDFWEDLHDRGSTAQGGLCLLAETYGDDSSLTNTLRGFRDDTLGSSQAGRWLSRAYYASAAKLGASVHGSIALRIVAAIVLAPAVALALAWYWLTLPGVLGLIAVAWLWRRHRGRVAGWARRLLRARAVRSATVISLVVLATGRAYAGGYEPYWETNDPTQSEAQPSAADDPGLAKWHVGIRLGRYIPDIDKQIGGANPRPYKQMFGGYRILPMLDVDRFLWTGFGQLGVGISLGYMQNTANAFADCNVPGVDCTTGVRPRAADTNAFRLIPLALTATYRFTYLDDEYGIPLVPYVRGGLSYYVWWISVANGSFAAVCKDGKTVDDEPGCTTDKALGASLGVQGSIGLALRAERIDSSAAMSMRQSGIEHAGLYAEYSVAKVDGFGSDKKLSVGDRTLFAGIDFEF
jgi:hypothetical protein